MYLNHDLKVAMIMVLIMDTIFSRYWKNSYRNFNSESE